MAILAVVRHYSDHIYNPAVVPLEQLQNLVLGQDSTATTNYFTIPVEGRLMAAGSSVPLLTNQFSNTSTGILIPDTISLPDVYDYIGVFVTINDYFPPSQSLTAAQMTDLIHTRTEPTSITSHLTALHIVRKALDHPDIIQQLQDDYLSFLPDVIRIYLTNRITTTSDSKRVFISRH